MTDPNSSFPHYFAASDLAPMQRLVDKVFGRVTRNPVTKVEIRLDDDEAATLAAELGSQAATIASKN